MSTENERTINLFEELGVSDERAHEINMEINAIRDNSEYLTEILSAIPKTYDRESVVAGVFLAEIILRDSGRLLPSDMSEAIAMSGLDELLKGVYEELEDPKISPKGEPENN